MQYHIWDYSDAESYLSKLAYLRSFQPAKIGLLGLTNADTAHLSCCCTRASPWPRTRCRCRCWTAG